MRAPLVAPLVAPRRLLLALALAASAAACGPPDGGAPDATDHDVVQVDDVAAPDAVDAVAPVAQDVAIDHARPPIDAARKVAMDAPATRAR